MDMSGVLLAVAVTEDIQAVGADLRTLAGHQVGEEASTAAGHGPAKGTVSGVEEQVAIGRGTNNRRAVRGRRAQAGPELGLRQVAALRVEIVGDHLQGFATTRVERQVETS